MRLTKLEAAKRQLDVASALFLANGDRLALHTLSGAAEEILGILAKRTGHLNMFERMRVALSDRLGKQVDGKELAKLVNTSRNALKHANKLSEDPFKYNPDHAVVMLFRALVNYQLVSGGLTDIMEKARERLNQDYPCLMRATK